MKKFLAMLSCAAFLFTGCGEKTTYKHLSVDEAKAMIEANPDAILLDVRTQKEYEAKHIPNAILITLEDLRKGDFSQIPNKNAKILAYCWVGRRAQDSAAILIEHGYKNVYEFNGLEEWLGELEGNKLYKHICQDEARNILETDPDAKLLDVRFQANYDARHIVGAIFVPLEDVKAERFDKIPDKDATLITYCGDGNRARLTAQALGEKGYRHVYEMGGIIDWTGPVEGAEVE